MSTDDRLARLGLLHLKDDPAALEQALRARAEDRAQQVAAWHAVRDEIFAGLPVEPPLAWVAAELSRLTETAQPDPNGSRALAVATGELHRRLDFLSAMPKVSVVAISGLLQLYRKVIDELGAIGEASYEVGLAAVAARVFAEAAAARRELVSKLHELPDKELAEILYDALLLRPSRDVPSAKRHFVLMTASLEESGWSLMAVCRPDETDGPRPWGPDAPICQQGQCRGCGTPVLGWDKQMICAVCGRQTSGS